MNQFHGEASLIIDATPDAAFDLIPDVDRLDEWNAAIEAVEERPPALTVGREWTVRMHPPRMPRWDSVSRVTEIDRPARRFSHETRNADGNPSSVDWSWRGEPPDGKRARGSGRWARPPPPTHPKTPSRPKRKRPPPPQGPPAPPPPPGA